MCISLGDTTIAYMEVVDREPHLIEGIRHSGEQTKGACLVPKRALNVMQGEVNRVLQLCSTSVIPIMYQVPRKTYRDFHADLYPDTSDCHTQLTANDWFQGKNIPLSKISLDPGKRPNGEQPITVSTTLLLYLCLLPNYAIFPNISALHWSVYVTFYFNFCGVIRCIKVTWKN